MLKQSVNIINTKVQKRNKHTPSTTTNIFLLWKKKKTKLIESHKLLQTSTKSDKLNWIINFWILRHKQWICIYSEKHSNLKKGCTPQNPLSPSKGRDIREKRKVPRKKKVKGERGDIPRWKKRNKRTKSKHL